MNPQWHDFLVRQGAVLANDRVADFAHPAQALQAASQGTIIADLSHFGLLQVEGDDALTFLQGQLTNDIKQLDGSNSHYAGYCTPKGRLLAIFLAFAHHDHLHLQLNGTLTESILKRLKMYVLRSKVTISDVSDVTVRFGLAGSNAEAVLGSLFSRVPQAVHQLATLDHANILRLPGATPRYEIFAAPEHAENIWIDLQKASTPVGAAYWEWLEIQAGIPDIFPATSEAFVPQMVNLDLLNAINFKKGCYTGQEIVARTHYLGKVKRRTYLAHVSSELTPQAGDLLFGSDSSEPVGQVVRAAAAPAGGFDVLAELRKETVTDGTIRLSLPEGPPLSLLDSPYMLS